MECTFFTLFTMLVRILFPLTLKTEGPIYVFYKGKLKDKNVSELNLVLKMCKNHYIVRSVD